MIEWVEGYSKAINSKYSRACWTLMVNGACLARIDGPCEAAEGFWTEAWRKPSADLESAKLRVLREGRIGLRAEIKRLQGQLKSIEMAVNPAQPAEPKEGA